MNLSHIGRRNGAVLGGLLGCGMIIALALLVFSGSASSETGPAVSPNPTFSVLEPNTAAARTGLPDNVQAWLATQEASALPGLKGEELVGLGIAQTRGGEAVVMQMGENVCAYMVTQETNSCGSVELIKSGSLYLFTPGCPSFVMGILPDGYSEITAESADVEDPESQSIPVTSNVYTAELKSVNTVLTGTSSNGESFKTELPLGQVKANCQG